MTLKSRITFGFFLLAVVPLALVGGILGYLEFDQQRTQGLISEREHALRVGIEASNHIERLVTKLEAATAAVDLFSQSEERQWSVISQLVASENLYEEIILVDASGFERAHVHYTDPTKAKNGSIHINDPAFLNPFVHNKTYFGPIHFNTETGEPLMSIGIPIFNIRRQGIEGVVLATLRLKRIWELIAELSLLSNEDILIADHTGRLIAHKNPSLVLRETKINLPIDDGIYENLKGKSAITAVYRFSLGEQSLAVVAQRALSQALLPAFYGVAIIASLILVALTMAWFMFALINRRIIKPVEHLAEIAQDIREGNLNRKAPINEHDEIGMLALAFNQMTYRLQHLIADLQDEVAERIQAEEELKEYRTHLEQLVEERTNDLEDANKQLEVSARQAERANQAKSDFLAKMSHELRTPLNAIIGITEMLIEEAEEEGDAETAEPLGRVNRAGSHLLKLINDILDISKIEAGKMELFPETIDLKDFIGDILETATPLAKTNANRLSHMVGNNLGTIFTDPTRLRQVLLNLLGNSCKFTEGGDVSLSVERRAGQDVDWIKFRVSDTGVGMTDQAVAKLFQDFTQVDDDTTRQAMGTGLGLSISKSICEMMGGSISVESAVGKGTTFSVEIPSFKEVAELSPPEISPLKKIAEGFRLALVIDDNDDACILLRHALEMENIDVLCAKSGEEGLRLAKSRKPCLITLDIKMPEMNGWEVLATLKSDPDTAHIPVIIVSIIDEVARGFDLGAIDYLVKPINRSLLRKQVRRLCPGKSNPKALIVDDDEGVRNHIRATLESDGFVVEEAANGKEALNRMQTYVPDIITLDLVMPEMDGFSFAETVRKNDAWASIPIIVVTAKGLCHADRRKLNSKISGLLPKSGDWALALRKLVNRNVYDDVPL